MKIIDLSKPIQYNKSDPWFMKVRIKHKSHKKSGVIAAFFWVCQKNYFPEGFMGWGRRYHKTNGGSRYNSFGCALALLTHCEWSSFQNHR